MELIPGGTGICCLFGAADPPGWLVVGWLIVVQKCNLGGGVVAKSPKTPGSPPQRPNFPCTKQPPTMDFVLLRLTVSLYLVKATKSLATSSAARWKLIVGRWRFEAF